MHAGRPLAPRIEEARKLVLRRDRNCYISAGIVTANLALGIFNGDVLCLLAAVILGILNGVSVGRTNKLVRDIEFIVALENAARLIVTLHDDVLQWIAAGEHPKVSTDGR